MRGLMLSCIFAVVGPGLALAETLQIQVRGSVPDGLNAELVLLDSASDGCRDAPCRVSSRKVKIPRHAKGGGVMNVEVEAPVSRICLQKVRTHKIVGATLFYHGSQKPTKMRRGETIARDGSSACTPKSVMVSDGKIWRVVIEK